METNHPDFKFAWQSLFSITFAVFTAMACRTVFSFKEMKDRCFGCGNCYNLRPALGRSGNFPIGRNTGLANLKYRKPNAIEVELNWYLYRNSKSELSLVLAEISGDLRTHAMDFFARSAQILRSDELLQYGLALVRDWKPLDENFRSSLEADWKAGRLRENAFYSSFQKVEADLREFATGAGLPTEDIRRYTIRLLHNFTKKGWSWENSRL